MTKHIPLLLACMVLGMNCKDEPTKTLDTTFAFIIDDASCTEVYLRFTLGADAATHQVTLKRDMTTIFAKTLPAGETIMVDTNLVSNHTYSYSATLEETTLQHAATTLDTTSHNWTWQIFTLGDGINSSTLHDVAIVNDTLAYAVGAVYQRDSLGGFDPHAYNMIKWDGTQWTPLRIQFYTVCGQASRTPYPASAVFEFDAHDIWIAMDGDQVARWNGISQTTTMCVPVSFSIKRLWGRDSASVYAGGDGGNIIYFDGSSWHRIESGTTLPFQDIWGNGDQILAVASDKFSLGGKYLVQISNKVATQLPTDISTAVSLSGVWFVVNRKYYLVGDGIYEKHSLSDSTWRFDPIIHQIQNYPYSVRGNGLNDIVVVCERGTIAHYNGVSWRVYDELPPLFGRLLSVSIKRNLIIAVGARFSDGAAVIYQGRR